MLTFYIQLLFSLFPSQYFDLNYSSLFNKPLPSVYGNNHFSFVLCRFVRDFLRKMVLNNEHPFSFVFYGRSTVIFVEYPLNFLKSFYGSFLKAMFLNGSAMLWKWLVSTFHPAVLHSHLLKNMMTKMFQRSIEGVEIKPRTLRLGRVWH